MTTGEDNKLLTRRLFSEVAAKGHLDVLGTLASLRVSRTRR